MQGLDLYQQLSRYGPDLLLLECDAALMAWIRSAALLVRQVALATRPSTGMRFEAASGALSCFPYLADEEFVRLQMPGIAIVGAAPFLVTDGPFLHGGSGVTLSAFGLVARLDRNRAIRRHFPLISRWRGEEQGASQFLRFVFGLFVPERKGDTGAQIGQNLSFKPRVLAQPDVVSRARVGDRDQPRAKCSPSGHRFCERGPQPFC